MKSDPDPAPVVMWFRRDLRLADHPALTAAAAAGREVVGLFVDDPAFDHAGAPRRAYLRAALDSLDASTGGQLTVRRGDPVEVVPAIAAEVGASAVHVTRDYGPYGRRRDAAVGARLTTAGVRLAGVGTPYAVAPGTVTKSDGSPYAVFTPFSRAWAAHGWDPPLPAPDVRWLRPANPAALPSAPDLPFELPAVGEEAAWARWERFVAERLGHYARDRNRPGLDATSHLSADLRWGVLHPRQLLADLDAGTFRNELCWREFYADVLLHHPESATTNLNQRMDPLPLDTDDDARARFERWAAGTTGFPIVDAGMRQLLATGWMHNRVRMIVASFLVKDLHLPWQWGARHFMEHLIDGDLASNSHGWQWTAGTGTDAAPYFRVFNPSSQAASFDPDGSYARQWIPELATDGYAAPMVDHAVERREALARYQLTRDRSAPPGSR